MIQKELTGKEYKFKRRDKTRLAKYGKGDEGKGREKVAEKKTGYGRNKWHMKKKK